METNFEKWHEQFKIKRMQAPLDELEQDIRQMEQQLKQAKQFADLSTLYYTEVNVFFQHSSAYKALQKLIAYRPYFEKYASRIEALRIRLGTYSLLEVAGYDETFFEGTYALLKEIRHVNSPTLEATALNNLGTYLLKNERYEEGIGYFLEAARILERHPEEFFGPLSFYLPLNIISTSYALNNKEQAAKYVEQLKQYREHDPFIDIFIDVIDMTWELDHGDANEALVIAQKLLNVDVTQYDNRIMMMLNNMLDVFRYHELPDEELIVLEHLIAFTKNASTEQVKQELVACQYGIQETIAYEGLYKDALTNVWNRNGFEKTVQPLVEQQTEKPKMLAIVDVDYFKTINDTYGHSIGDAALQEICARAERVISRYTEQTPTLYFGRYGGDEFLLYYEASEQAQLEQLIKELHEAITAQPFKERQTSFPLSISLGAIATKQPMTYEHMLQQADDALYNMKKQQKGRYTIEWR